MLALVFVSHSRKLAESLCALAQDISPAQVPIACAGGAGDDHAAFGTDALDIAAAIQRVAHPNGVLVLMDMGSAVLSAQMALEFLPEDLRQRVHFCPAPLVEGAIAAAVQASLTDDIETVCREAQGALRGKAEQLGFESGLQTPEAAAPPAETAHQRMLTLVNPHGLHARPAAQFVQCAARFEAEIQVRNHSTAKGPVSARSLNALATLGALQGHTLLVTASGPQAEAALEALAALVEDGFGEREQPETPPPSEQVQPPAGAFAGIPIADGIALGETYIHRPAEPLVPSHPASDPQAEWQRLQEALQQAEKAIRKRRARVAAQAGEAEAAIFDAHALLLHDPDLLEATRRGIQQAGRNAAAAWQEAVERAAAAYEALPDAYLRQRAADVRDVGRQVLLLLTGGRTHAPHFARPVILLAKDLTPTETAQLDLDKVLGIATLQGGPTSHSAILARALGIPALAGLPPQVLHTADGTPAALDGFRGHFWVQPDAETRAALLTRREQWRARQQALLAQVHQAAVTRDGHRLEVAANAGSLEEAVAARRQGAEGIGLLRTEFLFLQRLTPPDEEAQREVLHTVGAAMEGRPVIVRTLDVGGDKPLPYIKQPEEANPFLGTRAIRLGFLQEDLFRTQLRAILRAGAEVNLRVMFPMVATLEEVRRARALLESVHQNLESEGIPHRWPIETGIMVEIPAAALSATILATEVDFFSIGTNDLTQYTLAAERGNPNLAYLSDGLHPAVLRLIRMVVEAAHAQGKWVGVCGELAGDPQAVPLLVGLGVDELSLNPAGIPQVKDIIRGLRAADAHQLATAALKAPDARGVRQLVEGAR
ncbi:MAG: phosphoenolpyruvate--protein phosphotransferase [Anaerolineales bacterium]